MRHARSIRILVTGIALSLTAAACSSSSDKPDTAPTTTTATTATTLSVADAAAAYTKPGPYPVGVTTRTLPKGNKVEIWYPAAKGSTGTQTYDVRDFVGPEIKKLLTGNLEATITSPGARDAQGADGTFPIVLFSHGFSGMRLQSTFMTAHLASWGMIVASPDHPSRDLYHLLGTPPKQDSVDDLQAALDVVLAENSASASPLSGHVDAKHVAAVGHSAGGGTVVGAAQRIAAVQGYVSMASGIFQARGDAATPTTTAAALPAKPSFFIAGANDQIAVVSKVTRPAFEQAPAPTRLWVLDKAGHNVFDDFCRVGGGAGIIGVAEASGLGPLLSNPPLSNIKKLGEDGCKAPDVPVDTVYPAINHAVTAWLRELFGTDAQPVGLGPSVSSSYAVKVSIEERLG